MKTKRPDFQYPRSDRRRCNSRVSSSPLRSNRLSVSSVGSEAMQLPPGSPNHPPTVPPFSILGRIGGDATTVKGA